MSPLYHRRVGTAEIEEVARSGQLWGKTPGQFAGGGWPCVKAFLGPLPEDASGFEFETEVPPTRYRRFVGYEGAVWEEGYPGVMAVPGHPDYVMIPVKLRRRRP
jgi:hypothetical protein